MISVDFIKEVLTDAEERLIYSKAHLKTVKKCLKLKKLYPFKNEEIDSMIRVLEISLNNTVSHVKNYHSRLK